MMRLRNSGPKTRSFLNDPSDDKVESTACMTLGKIYTLAEVAGHLRLTNRAVAKIARARGLCMVAGRTMTFTEEDVEGIKLAMRLKPTRTPATQRLTKTVSASPSVRMLVLQRSKRPSHKKMFEAELGEE